MTATNEFRVTWKSRGAAPCTTMYATKEDALAAAQQGFMHYKVTRVVVEALEAGEWRQIASRGRNKPLVVKER